MPGPIDFATKRVMRGVILKLIYQKHERQETRFRDLTLLAALDQLSFRVYEDLVRELLQDLSERGLLKFESEKNRKTGAVAIWAIQLTPLGRDIVEGYVKDAAVDVG
jgi:hypothetical protein